ncbi:2-methoxy-6-polyprenyl-1,4-benzoquinol methylase, mitochondrial isoform X2 [Canis lupus baileyi]|uniref:2-methoxy-6-polyprenyl-1,4-benzoquinol methylase, mitochondrial isoform X2 n=1 Tax=Canis lupus familiaris TaxID=9615 RepID=UPI000BAA17EC|nr:2-methoxy-6-polyprenyl-1,4-benzoquinol methylase, mitochondrial isoform X2 [Canis lupus familiaris]XP_025329984.1 2-methoxy-6-polyprenyl-1,4-benzoquinol methylase, mitochondrial isoform X2 [Canis lupus dingo]XP_038292856.1 2-methoxy-6-polyprenyl-1,4-benzoquinol methylase, mitochondrial isoform X2 [Canis lupus familiaris]XP_038431247.1 2-methoxy-6-polyprenyl-1,4-benzoquinol methylase, mitochondrial isoform X2 [Canis lupus familiaris]|eukprot:XP_022266148.1 2-methoxy-6-polyprenyl-1,4-benzoquinol methylase, mitochondrial isoform X2 [Canis lupus familiaris]
MATHRSCALWSYCGRRWSRVMRCCRLSGLCSSWPSGPLGARHLSQEKPATETHFGFETVSEEEKRGKGDIAFRFLNYVQAQHKGKQKRQLRAQQNLSWEEIAKKYQNEEDPLGGSRVVVCDINKEMLKIGKQKARAQGYKAGLAWVLGDAEELPFDDDKFDVYTIAFGIRNVTHIDQALQEAHRVLKPGGRFLCLEFSQVNNPLISRLYDLYSFQVIPVLGEVIAGDWKSYQYLVESIRQFPSQEEFREMIEDAGFEKVTYESLTSGIVAIHSGFKL